MSKQHILDIIHTAQGRAAAIHATAPGFAFNKALSMEGYLASIDAARDEVFQYIALQSRLNAQRGRMLAAGRALAEWSSRMLCAVHSTFGKDSHPYQAAAAVKSSAPRRRPRKRRAVAVAVAAATGMRADKSPAGRSAVREPVEDVHPVAHEGLVGKGLVDVGRDGAASTAPHVDVGDETEAVRRTEVLAPHECQASDAGSADEVEHGWEVDGAVEVAEEDVGGSKPQSVAIDAADAGRALTDALAAPAAIHEDAPLAGKDPCADVNPACPHVAEGAEDQGERDGEGERDGSAGAIQLGRSCLLDLLLQILRRSLVTGLASARASLTPRLAEASASQSLPSQLNRSGLAGLEWEARLPQERLVRVHGSLLVRLDLISDLRTGSRDGYTVELAGGWVVQVGRVPGLRVRRLLPEKMETGAMASSGHGLGEGP